MIKLSDADFDKIIAHHSDFIYSHKESFVDCIHEGMEYYTRVISTTVPTLMIMSDVDYDIIQNYVIQNFPEYVETVGADNLFVSSNTYGSSYAVRAPEGRITPGCVILIQDTLDIDTAFCIIMSEIYNNHTEAEHNLIYSYAGASAKFLTS